MSTLFSSFLSPGVRVRENTAGAASAELASHVTTYMLGFGSLGAKNIPTKVNSLVDFTNQFGSSLSENSVKLFFRNRPGRNDGILYFVNAAIADQFTIEITDTATGTHPITLNGESIDVDVEVGDTIADIRDSVITALNLNAGDTASASAGTAANTVVIRSDDPDTALEVSSAAAIFTVTETTPNYPTFQDFVYSLEQAFDAEDDYPQGFLIAPEFFQNTISATERLSVGNAMRDLAQSEGFDWVAFIDPHPSVTTVAQVQADSQQYTTTKGHLAYYAPYLIDLEGNPVPPSAAIAGVAATRYEAEGFQEPIGGNRYTVFGVNDVAIRYITSDQDVLNPLGVNLIRNLRNKGVKIWGLRSRSADPLYTQLHVRVIMNVLNGTLRKSFDNYPFSSIDGLGVLFHLIEQTAIQVCRQLYQGRALFGATEDEAFAVECSFRNNLIEDIQQGNVYCAIYAAPVPALEKLLLGTFRVSLSTGVQQALALGLGEVA